MPDYRVFCPASAPLPDTGKLHLSAAESHHLVAVNRAREGAPVVAFDGAGAEWDTTLARADRRAAELTIRQRRAAPPRRCELTLVQSLPKGGAMDTIVRQATEIGVARIVPVITSQSQVQLDDSRAERKTARWRTTALEAAKQCGNPWLPAIESPRAWADWIANPPDTGELLIASLHPGGSSLREWMASAGGKPQPFPRVTWLIGPEGDFTADEMAAALRLGAKPLSLGPLVLRCDTAAAVALGATQALFAS